MGFSGLAARGAAESLDQLLAQALQRDQLDQQRADRERAFGMQARGLDLQERDATTREGQLTRQDAADRERATLAEQAAKRKEDADAYAATARANMAELVDNPTQLAAFALASGQDIPKGVESIVRPKEAKFVKVTVPGPKGEPRARMVREDEIPPEGIQEYREPKPPKEKEDKRQWVMRNGQEVYDIYQPGDTRATATGSNSTTPAQQAASRRAVNEILSKVRAISGRINTIDNGFKAKAAGAGRQVMAWAGMDNDVNEYEGLLRSAVPLLARAYGHTGVLTQQDVESVLKGFPTTGTNADLRVRLLRNVEDIISKTANENPDPEPSHGTPDAAQIQDFTDLIRANRARRGPGPR